MRLSNSYVSFKTPLHTAPSSGKPSQSAPPWLTFDLGNERAGSCERLHGVQERVFGDDLAHHAQGFTQALVGQRPPGLEEVCQAEGAWVRRKGLVPGFPASQR